MRCCPATSFQKSGDLPPGPEAGDNERMKRQRNAAHRGFTLMEIMLVVLIISIMSSLAIPYYLHMSGRASRSEAQVVLSKMRVYFVNLYENQGTFLTGTQSA